MTHVTMKHVELRGLESLGLVGPDKTARRLHLMTPAEFTAWRDGGDAALQDWIAANAFTGTSGSALVLTKSLFGNTAGGRPAMDAIGIIGNIPIGDAAASARALTNGRSITAHGLQASTPSTRHGSSAHRRPDP